MPTKTVVKDGVERKVYPSPTTEEARSEFWGNRQPEANCVSCHQNGPWLRTPFASSVGPENGKGYVREGRTGAYRPGTGNNVPADPKLDQFGPPCSVGLPEWNRPEGSLAPFPVKIDADAFDRKVPRPAGQRRDPAEARAGECTRCHYIGVGPAADGGDNCQKYLPEIRTGANANRLAAHRFWMPPDAGELTPAEFQARYGRAIAALEWCCSQRADPDWRRICANRFSTTRMPEARLLDQLAGPRGACALCADCVPPARSGRRGPRGPRGTTGAPGGTHF
jgi:mono/diheme cytochrome c family protein